MAINRTEKIANIQQQIAQLQAQEKQLIQKEKEESRKARTKRLIERGAILESLISEAETLTNAQVKLLLEKTVASSYGVKMLDGIKTQHHPAPVAKSTETEEEVS